MIIDASTIILTLVVVSIGLYGGLQLVRQFALQIAQENHDALAILDQRAEDERLRRERVADAAASSAFAKVQPILTKAAIATPNNDKNNKPSPAKSTTGELKITSTQSSSPSKSPTNFSSNV